LLEKRTLLFAEGWLSTMLEYITSKKWEYPLSG